MNDIVFRNGIPTRCFISNLPTSSMADNIDDYRYSVKDENEKKYLFQFQHGFRPTVLICEYKAAIWKLIKAGSIQPKDLASNNLITVDSLETYIKENLHDEAKNS